MKITLFFILFFALSFLSVAQFHTNRPEIVSKSFHSKVLNEDREILIYRPEIFPEFKDVKPPIIYVMDGSYFADIIVSYVNLYCEKVTDLPPIMVVGIGNSDLRDRDYTPAKASDSNSNGADKFMQFLITEVMPDIERDYKTPPFRVIAGHSRGGLMVMHAFSHYPQIFQAGIASSPYLEGNSNAYFPELITRLTTPGGGQRSLFFSVANEGGRYLPNAQHIDSLLSRTKVDGLEHQFIHYPNEGHGSVLPKSMYDGFKFIFPLLIPPMEQKPFSYNYAILENHWKKLSVMFGISMSPRERDVNSLGYQYLEEWKDVDNALMSFRKNIELHPSSGNAYDSYAEALMIKGDKRNAIINYEKSLQLDPSNENAKEMLTKLKK